MRSFRTELENPVVEKDIIELERKIFEFKEGKIDEERFRSLRLARGVYGQRQQGVQMIRIKLPCGRLNVRQLRRIADVADEYSNGHLHITTRQDIQIHYVSLDRTPELWAQLEKDEVTLREACGNTVRNVTTAPTAGIDPAEPFDVTPYAYAFFSYFLRNPICQEMGRKFKVSFSATDRDRAFAYIHDLGFIPKVKNGKRGFKVMIGGGLGAQPVPALTAFEFLAADQIIPLAEAVLRVFDRHGERSKRFKARFKFLLKKYGLEEVFRLVEDERKALAHSHYEISGAESTVPLPQFKEVPVVNISSPEAYKLWYETNVFQQKQKEYFAVGIKVQLGNLSTNTARKLANLIEAYAGDDIRLTVGQGILLRYIRPEHLPFIYQQLDQLGLAEAGYDSTADITACPGTDTCNLGISNSTEISRVFEQLIGVEYPDLIKNNDLNIKISGCMNACGQHSLSSIGFHGSTLKAGDHVAPALQVLLGGGTFGDGAGVFGQKVIKIPSKRGPQALRLIFNDYLENRLEGEYYFAYFKRMGKKYFYGLLKPLSDVSNLQPSDFLDWGHQEHFEPEIGVGECAGVIIDLVATLVQEAKEKTDLAFRSLVEGKWADSIYHSYSALIQGAKAVLVSKDFPTNTQAGIIRDFDKHITRIDNLHDEDSFSELVYQIQDHQPSESFAKSYYADSTAFLLFVQQLLDKQPQYVQSKN